MWFQLAGLIPVVYQATKKKIMSPRWFHFAKHGDMVHLLCFMCSNQLSMIVNGSDMKIHSKEVHPGFQFCLYVQVF
jgi:hypothetical protein